jgi:hypothetical protein
MARRQWLCNSPVSGLVRAVVVSITVAVATLPSFSNALFPGPVFAVGERPSSLILADFNGDGLQDVATANEGADDVSVLLGSGDGSLAGERRFPVGDSPWAIAAGELNGDGNHDLVTANAGANSVSVLLGNGDGTFAPELRFGVGEFPVSVSIADFDADGRLDVTTANSGSGDVSVIQGGGDGTLGPELRYGVGDLPTSVEVADLDGDDILDLVTTNAAADSVSVLLGNGDGSFASEWRVDLGCGRYDFPLSTVSGEFNGDGFPDLMTIGCSTELLLLLGNGDGTFAVTRGLYEPDTPGALAVGDFDDDGR